jgi:hypothetical protein
VMRAGWVAGSVMATAACASAPTPRVASPSGDATVQLTPSGAATPLSVQPEKMRAPPVTVLYRGRTPSDFVRPGTLVLTTLFGVEESRERAWLTHSISGGGVAAYELVHVPLSEASPDAAPLERWTATPKAATFLVASEFYPLTGALEGDLARYAEIVETVGSHVTTNEREVRVSHDHILYEDGDHLTLRDRDGKKARYFSRGVQSAYAPVLSPDGQTAAFFGCDGAIANRGRTLPEVQACYALYVAPLTGSPVRIPEVAESSAPVFSADGRFVYATSALRSKTDVSKRNGGCLFRVDAAAPHAREKLFCAPSDGDLVFHLASDGQTAVVGATTRATDHAIDYSWLRLPDGKVLGTATIPLASPFGGSLGADGLLVTTAGAGVVVANATGTVRVVPGLETAFVSVKAQWDGDRVYVLRTSAPDVEEILRIDARAVIAAPP